MKTKKQKSILYVVVVNGFETGWCVGAVFQIADFLDSFPQFKMTDKFTFKKIKS